MWGQHVYLASSLLVTLASLQNLAYGIWVKQRMGVALRAGEGTGAHFPAPGTQPCPPLALIPGRPFWTLSSKQVGSVHLRGFTQGAVVVS